MDSNEFDYIIAGGGLAGLSLARKLSRSSLGARRTLVIDRVHKYSNDHTWCFWSDGPSEFDDLVFRRWKTLWFHGADGGSNLLDIGSEGFDYRMIRSADFYSSVIPEISENDAFVILQAEVSGITSREVVTDKGTFLARRLVFDSVTSPEVMESGSHNLLQHFLGWYVAAESDVFDPQAATLFDFRVPQNGDCRFVYILPESPRRALVEFTVFSEQPLDLAEYEYGLKEYISAVLNVSDYSVESIERGVIPMSDAPRPVRPYDGVVRIGTAGGYVKPSTGYSFSRTEERIAELVKDLEAGGDGSVTSGTGRWKSMLDSVLLDVLANRRSEAAMVFQRLFRRNPPARVLRFLDEKTDFADDLKIMRTVPLVPFSNSFLREMWRKPFR